MSNGTASRIGGSVSRRRECCRHFSAKSLQLLPRTEHELACSEPSYFWSPVGSLGPFWHEALTSFPFALLGGWAGILVARVLIRRLRRDRGREPPNQRMIRTWSRPRPNLGK